MAEEQSPLAFTAMFPDYLKGEWDGPRIGRTWTDGNDYYVEHANTELRDGALWKIRIAPEDSFRAIGGVRCSDLTLITPKPTDTEPLCPCEELPVCALNDQYAHLIRENIRLEAELASLRSVAVEQPNRFDTAIKIFGQLFNNEERMSYRQMMEDSFSIADIAIELNRQTPGGKNDATAEQRGREQAAVVCDNRCKELMKAKGGGYVGHVRAALLAANEADKCARAIRQFSSTDNGANP